MLRFNQSGLGWPSEPERWMPRAMPNKVQSLFAFSALLFTLCASATPEAVSFNSLDGTLLKAWVFQPKDFALRGTVIALHGCSGLYAGAGPRKVQLNGRHQAMADLLVAEGYAVVFPDSLTPRGEAELCTQKIDSRKISQTERRADTLAALAWVRVQPWAQRATGGAPIALLGWSHGGSAVLAATDAARADVREQAPRPVVAIAFYPGCSTSLKTNYQPSAPLLLMLGELDDWTPPGPCIALGKSVGAEVNIFSGSHHGFDSPAGKVRRRTDVPDGATPGRGVHVGPNPAAREQAYARLREVLRDAMK